jgi:hypothetical protein
MCYWPKRCPKALALWWLIAPIGASAHHSQAEYDRTVVKELEGQVVKVTWSNPHVGLTIRTRSPNGTDELWQMGAADLISTVRRGVPANMGLAVGDAVTVAGYVSTRRPGRMLVTNVLTPSGTEVLLVQTGPRWSARTVGGGQWLDDAAVAAAAKPRGIFRVWTLDRTVRPPYADSPPLTAAARAGHDEYDPVVDDPALQCMSIGMPRAITRTGPHPIEFVERDGNIHVLMEYFDLERVIHMDSQANAADVPASALGYSVGRWEDGALIVTTTRINWPYFDIRDLEGVPQSEAVEILERFILSADETELSYDITVTDPAMFTEPVAAPGYALWRWRPGVKVEPYECRLE